MKANELRIGNLVKDSFGVIEISITGESYFEKTIYDFGKIEFASIYEPIPLTEEWLLKFGFEKTSRINIGELKPCFAIFSFAAMVRHNSFFIDWVGGNIEVKYVHQFQNLYFALTDEELTMK